MRRAGEVTVVFDIRERSVNAESFFTEYRRNAPVSTEWERFFRVSLCGTPPLQGGAFLRSRLSNKSEWNREFVFLQSRLCRKILRQSGFFVFSKGAIFMFEGLKQDINAVRERDPAAPSAFQVLLMYSGLHAIMWHRPAYWLWNHGFKFTARALSQIVRGATGVEIHPAAKLGRGILIDHGMGVVIGETAEVGDGCTIYQGVTLGGTGKHTGKRHPTLEKNVTVGCGAKVLGPFTVGEGSKIAANAIVLSEIPEYSTAVGVPARVVRQYGKKIEQLDQIHIPDPVSQELCRLRAEIERLEKEVEELKGAEK